MREVMHEGHEGEAMHEGHEGEATHEGRPCMRRMRGRPCMRGGHVRGEVMRGGRSRIRDDANG